MNSITIGPVPVIARTVADGEQEAALGWLAGQWDNLGDKRWQLLAEWACRDLTPQQREETFGEYRAVVALAADLEDGIVTWDQVDETLNPDGHQQQHAIETVTREAGVLLAMLMDGTGTKS